MKRVIIICEGQTEQVFCERTLSPYMIGKGYHIQAPTIKHTRGGIVKWDILEKQIETHLKSEKDAFVTTFIDYYGLYKKFEFPGWDEAELIPDKNTRMEKIESEMRARINSSYRNRFIPYMQLHEFEGLLFNDINIFINQIPKDDLIGLSELKQIFVDYANPEMINSGRSTAPSKRLSRIILGYNKVVYGDIIAESIGLERIRNKSPRFNNWIETLESL
ncbi:DUF4276 family protein [Pedobacter sp. N36a]|uniref:DUF4276 family protein n=1 Tax=Pedobacter sp. N36a TaxID=2767996 RepID=UPI001656FD2F|nr:DUF4276 family protein [Pedobacter sp. N36a]MBC8987551.1 DUF4276 family protein [Pedobacter sp. N36a]